MISSNDRSLSHDSSNLRFKSERQSVIDEPEVQEQLASQPRQWNFIIKAVKQQIEQWIHKYRRFVFDETAIEYNMSHGSVYNIVHGDLGYRKVCSKSIPSQLSDDHKCARQTICGENLNRYARKGYAFLYWIVTEDKFWVYYEPESKRQSMQSCWSSFGMLMALCHFHGKGQTVTSAWYSDMLINKLKLEMRSKCRRLLSKRNSEYTRPTQQITLKCEQFRSFLFI